MRRSSIASPTRRGGGAPKSTEGRLPGGDDGASSGSDCTSRTRNCCAPCSSVSPCTIWRSRTRCSRTSARSSKSTAIRCSSRCAPRNWSNTRSSSARRTSSPGRGYVVTVRHGSTTAYREVRARCESAPKMLAMGESFVVYSIIDFIVDNYFPVLHGLEAEADALEEEVFAQRATGPTSNASTSCATSCCCCAARCSRCRRSATASCATTCR